MQAILSERRLVSFVTLTFFAPICHNFLLLDPHGAKINDANSPPIPEYSEMSALSADDTENIRG